MARMLDLRRAPETGPFGLTGDESRFPSNPEFLVIQIAVTMRLQPSHEVSQVTKSVGIRKTERFGRSLALPEGQNLQGGGSNGAGPEPDLVRRFGPNERQRTTKPLTCISRMQFGVVRSLAFYRVIKVV
jgi:hypothetical protein